MDIVDEPVMPSAAEASDGAAHAHLAGVLDTLRAAVVELMTSVARPPVRLRLRAAGATVEMEWSEAPDMSMLRARGYSPLREDVEPLRDGGRRAEVRPIAVEPEVHCVCAPTVGVFYRAPEPGSSPFVEVGDVVTAGQQLGIVEAMKLMIPVEADRAGRIREILPADATAVEYGERLFAITTEHAA